MINDMLTLTTLGLQFWLAMATTTVEGPHDSVLVRAASSRTIKNSPAWKRRVLGWFPLLTNISSQHGTMLRTSVNGSWKPAPQWAEHSKLTLRYGGPLHWELVKPGLQPPLRFSSWKKSQGHGLQTPLWFEWPRPSRVEISAAKISHVLIM
jgi:hypothetical protein